MPDSYLKFLDILGLKYNESRSSLVRRALNDFLNDEEKYQAKINEEIKEKYRKPTLPFYRFCIACDSRVVTQTELFKRNYPNLNIFELRFCCSCFAKYENTPLNKLPKALLKKIQDKIREYKASFS